MGGRNYAGKSFKSLSVTPLNDVKDMTSLLQKAGFGLENTFDDLKSSKNLYDILNSYVEAVNKEEEDIGKKAAASRLVVVFLSSMPLSML